MHPLPPPCPRRRGFLSRLASLALRFGLPAVLTAPAAAQQIPAEPAPEQAGPLADDLPPALGKSAYLRQALDLHLKLEEFDEAQALADQLLAKNRDDPQAVAATAIVALHRRDAPQALYWAQRLRGISPDPETDAIMVAALNLNHRTGEALDLLARLARRTPAGEPFPHLLLVGYTYYAARNLPLARDSFEAVRRDPRYPDPQRAEAARQLANISRDKEIARAYQAIEQRRLRKARSIAEDLASAPADKPRSDLAALIAILDAEQHGKTGEAVAALESLRARSPQEEARAYSAAYAIQLLDQARYREAHRVALKAANSEHPESPDDLGGRLAALRAVCRYARPSVSLDTRFEDRGEGSAWRVGAEASLPVADGRTRLTAELEYHTSNLTGAAIPHATSDYLAACLEARRQLTGHLFASAALGAVDRNFAYRLSLGWRRPSQDTLFEVTFADGQRPTDTLQLEALGARERRLAMHASTEIPGLRRCRLTAEAFLREIDLGNAAFSDLGQGWGARVQLEYLLYRQRRTMLSLAYRGAAEGFDFSSSARRLAGALPYDPLGLVEKDFHSHGFALLAHRTFTPDFSAFLRLGADYRFDSGESVYSVEGGLEYWFSDLSRLGLDLSYYSSGRAAGSEAGYFEARLGMLTSF